MEVSNADWAALGCWCWCWECCCEEADWEIPTPKLEPTEDREAVDPFDDWEESSSIPSGSKAGTGPEEALEDGWVAG